MTAKVRVNLKERSYDIVTDAGLLGRAAKYLGGLGLGKDAVIITHPKLLRLYGRALSLSLRHSGYSVKTFTVPEGEKSKSADCALKLLEKIAAYDVGRRIFIIALGGGVVGDLAGFVASIYKRGVPYIQVPTTLLAQIDSAIGGKTAIDLRYGKNLVGAIYQPKLVLMDTDVLTTLSVRQIKNGLAEAIKYGIIKDPALFNFIAANHQQFLNGDKAVIKAIIGRCAKIKADVVAKDEYDVTGLRAILNFGHTVGHAIEAASKYGEYQHGEAVALGMRVAASISVRLKMLSSADAAKINDLITAVGLPRVIARVKLHDILKLMMHDKKFVGNKKRFILATTIGRVARVNDVSTDVIRQAIKEAMA